MLVIFVLPAITRKRLTETKKLNTGLEKYVREQHNYVHRKEDVSPNEKLYCFTTNQYLFLLFMEQLFNTGKGV